MTGRIVVIGVLGGFLLRPLLPTVTSIQVLFLEKDNMGLKGTRLKSDLDL